MKRYKFTLTKYQRVKTTWCAEFALNDQSAWDELIERARVADRETFDLYEFPEKASDDPEMWFNLCVLNHSGERPFRIVEENVAVPDGDETREDQLQDEDGKIIYDEAY